MNSVQYPAELPRAESCYLDANFLIALGNPVHRKYQDAQTLMKTLLRLKYTFFLSHLSLAEFWFNSLKLFLRQDGEKRPPAVVLRLEPQKLHPYHSRLDSALKRLLQISTMQLIGYPNDHYLPSDALRHGFGAQVLLPFDAFHLEYSLKARARYLVTEDRDFSGVTVPGSQLEILRY